MIFLSESDVLEESISLEDSDEDYDYTYDYDYDEDEDMNSSKCYFVFVPGGLILLLHPSPFSLSERIWEFQLVLC